MCNKIRYLTIIFIEIHFDDFFENTKYIYRSFIV